MPAPIVLSGVFPSWVLLSACLAAGAAAVMVVTAVVRPADAAPAARPAAAAHRAGPRAEKPSHHALVHR
jgi:hypothetical protein